MAELDLRASGEHRYDVTVTSGNGEQTYTLVVPPSYLESLDTDRDEPTIVRAAVALLDEAGAAVPAEISLDQAEAVAPGFDGRLRAVVRS
jgi:hypothetical protein